MFIQNEINTKQSLINMKIKILLALLLPIAIFFGSCVTPRDTNLLQNIQKDYPMAKNFINSDYRIISGDQLVLTIYTLDEDMKDLFAMYIGKARGASNAITSLGVDTRGSDNQSNTLNVYSDGTINIPYLGKIYVEDMTLLEAKKVVEARFASFSPNINIELGLRNRYFSVLGEARRGVYAMPTPKVTIFQALAISGGGINTFGDRTKVRIIRQTPNGTEVKMFDIRSKDIVNSEYYYIQPNDVIYVQEMSRTFFGRVTSFTGALGLVGILFSVVAAVTLIVNLTK